MTATVLPGAGPGPGSHSYRPLAQSLALSQRAVVGLVRQPQVWLPSIIFPLFFAALNTAAFNRATAIPDFPAADSFLDFLYPATIVQGVLFGGLGASSALAEDIETGFFDRLIAAPAWRSSILVGRLAGAAALGAFQALVFVGVFTAFGAEVKAGIGGLLVLPVVAMVLATAVGAIGSAMALRTGSVEAVQGAFPLVFITIFASSAFFPRELMKGWFQDVATVNPISWMIEGMRHLVLVGFDTGEALVALAVPLVLTVLATLLSLRSLRRRLAAVA